MNDSSRYVYKHLQSRTIRLLHLKPGESHAPLQVSLSHAHLDDRNLKYTALSYAWGEFNPRRAITVNMAEGIVEVTVNCEAALRVLRKPRDEVILWVDAICINQGNTDERSAQVLLMPQIYSLARQVFACLGEASEHSNLVMDFIQDDLAFVGRRPSIGPAQRTAFSRVFARPYFERAWIMQEILLARDLYIVIGRRIENWKYFSSAVTYVATNTQQNLGERYAETIPAVIPWRDTSAIDRPQTLLQFLDKTRYCKSSEPRDKVYAMMAMTQEGKEPSIAPNYNLPTREVFLSVAKFLLRHHKNLDLLCHCQKTPGYNLPSWVPDWSSPRKSSTLGAPKPSPRPFKADGGQFNDATFEEDSRVLVVKGVVFDRIAQIGRIYHKGLGSSAILQEWKSTLAWLAAESHRMSAREASVAFMETAMASPAYENNTLLTFHAAWCAVMLGQGIVKAEEESSAMIIQQRVDAMCHGRKFFVTERGYIGIGPPEMEEGFEIVILVGGQVPFVLRSAERGTYRLVGECYVHRFMRGEGMHGREGEGMRTFRLI